MLTACYVLSGLCFVSSIATAIGYTNRRRFIAPTAKLVASACFILIALFCNFSNSRSGSYGMMIFAALVCGLVGDILLMVKEFFAGNDSDYFLVMGVLAFAVGHVVYTARFLMLAPRFYFWLLPLLALPPVTMLIMTKMKMLKMGRLAPFMLGYSTILCMTMVATLNLALTTHSRLSALVLIASLLFLISDSALCMNYYGRETMKLATNYVVMPFYFIGQVLFAFSIILI